MAFSRTQAYHDGWCAGIDKILSFVRQNPQASREHIAMYAAAIRSNAEGDEMYRAADGNPPIQEHRDIVREITGGTDS